MKYKKEGREVWEARRRETVEEEQEGREIRREGSESEFGEGRRNGRGEEEERRGMAK